MIDKYIGQQIKNARCMHNMSQSELGAKIGVTFQQVQKYENGKNRVSAATLLKVATALRKPVLYFYPGNDAAQPVDETGLVKVRRDEIDGMIASLQAILKKKKGAA